MFIQQTPSSQFSRVESTCLMSRGMIPFRPRHYQCRFDNSCVCIFNVVGCLRFILRVYILYLLVFLWILNCSDWYRSLRDEKWWRGGREGKKAPQPFSSRASGSVRGGGGGDDDEGERCGTNPECAIDPPALASNYQVWSPLPWLGLRSILGPPGSRISRPEVLQGHGTR